jgi:hypothetical protein
VHGPTGTKHFQGMGSPSTAVIAQMQVTTLEGAS